MAHFAAIVDEYYTNQMVLKSGSSQYYEKAWDGLRGGKWQISLSIRKKDPRSDRRLEALFKYVCVSMR